MLKRGHGVQGFPLSQRPLLNEMKKVLSEIQDATFANQWIEENRTGRPFYNQVKADELKHPIVNTGKTLRTMMKLEGDK